MKTARLKITARELKGLVHSNACLVYIYSPGGACTYYLSNGHVDFWVYNYPDISVGLCLAQPKRQYFFLDLQSSTVDYYLKAINWRKNKTWHIYVYSKDSVCLLYKLLAFQNSTVDYYYSLICRARIRIRTLGGTARPGPSCSCWSRSWCPSRDCLERPPGSELDWKWSDTSRLTTTSYVTHINTFSVGAEFLTILTRPISG